MGREVKKKVVKRARPRNKKEKAPDQHAGLCTVCKHSQKEEIESRFMRFEAVDDLATTFEVTRDAIYRHARYYGLTQKRVGDTEKVLELLIERGMVKAADVPVNMIVESVKELHKVRGKHKEPGKNPEDAARAALAEFLAKNPTARREEIAPIYAEQYGVSVDVISEGIN